MLALRIPMAAVHTSTLIVKKKSFTIGSKEG
jgi:hypothetical protein